MVKKINIINLETVSLRKTERCCSLVKNPVKRAGYNSST